MFYFFKPKYSFLPALMTLSLVLAACDVGGEKSVKQWKKVPVNLKLSETRTAGQNYEWVLMSMAETKDIALKPLSDETPSELLDAENIDPVNAVPPQEAKGQSMMGIRISKKIEVPYGPLNFYGTRPREREDIHILDERPKITILKDYNDRQKEQAVEEITDEPSLDDVIAEFEDNKVKPEDILAEEPTEPQQLPKSNQEKVKKADKIFERFALGNKK